MDCRNNDPETRIPPPTIDHSLYLVKEIIAVKTHNIIPPHEIYPIGFVFIRYAPAKIYTKPVKYLWIAEAINISNHTLLL
jgi:hypothetical protein